MSLWFVHGPTPRVRISPVLQVDDTLGFVKHRTFSRIVEMSSQTFAREHARLHCPALLSSLPPPDPQPVGL